METKKYEIEGPKESVELGEGLEKFGKAMHQALKDGWQPGTDIPVFLMSAISDLAPAFQGAEKLGEEAKIDPVGLGQAIANAGMNIAKVLLKKD